MRRSTIYALSLDAHASLGVDVGSICWGSCGKGSVGGIDLGEYGAAIPCAVKAKECPHFDSEMPMPMGTIDFKDEKYNVVLRKLRKDRKP